MVLSLTKRGNIKLKRLPVKHRAFSKINGSNRTILKFNISASGMYILTKEKERRGNYLELTCNSLFSLT